MKLVFLKNGVRIVGQYGKEFVACLFPLLGNIAHAVTLYDTASAELLHIGELGVFFSISKNCRY